MFQRINLVLTTTWSVVFLVCAGPGLLAEQDVAKVWRDWHIPIAPIFLTIRFTALYPVQAQPLVDHDGHQLDYRAGC